MLRRISFYYSISRGEILETFELKDVFDYYAEAIFLHAESLGKKIKRPTKIEDRQFELDRQEMLRKIYEKA